MFMVMVTSVMLAAPVASAIAATVRMIVPRTPQQGAPTNPGVKPAATAGAKPGVSPEVKPAGAPLAPPAEPTREQLEARSLASQAVTQFEKRELAKAIELAQKAIALDVTYELPVRVVGWCAVASGDDQKAAEVLTRALNLVPSDHELQLLLAGCHKRLGEWGAAKDLLADLLKKQGRSLPVLLELSECCLGEEDFDGALAVLTEARTLAPKERSVGEHFVDVHEKKSDWPAATLELRTLLTAAPSDAPVRWRLIQCLLNASKFADAAVELVEATRVFRDDPQPHHLLEQLYAGPVADAEKLELERAWLKEWNLRRR